MGVPKFFRYISERYPCLSELVRENQVPEFDNLYLDMNGIIHNCSHPNDGDVHFRITEEQIFKDIFYYLETLFNMIKPQKLFFLAVDGVAPRAKMNQQRGRRFRSAKEAELQEEKARQKGEMLPTEARFDSNCITPGTPFMCRLNSALRYFIQHKISTSKDWHNCTVILSGHETPGEGEHKIMEYVRYLKTQKSYDPNTRHCLYGLDADLIMLGLCTHERHFSLLREEVKFGKKNAKTVSVSQQRFFLLHLSLMREYLEQEFISLKDIMKVPFDIEKVIDDWVLMGFLVGNDFIPNIPNFHINTNALPMLYGAYIKTMPTLDGYINEGGCLNLARLQAFIENLAQFDREHFESQYDDLKFLESKHQGGFNARNDDTFGGNQDLEALVKATEFEFDSPLDDEVDDIESDEKNFEKEFHQHRRDYYVNKMKYADMTPEVLAEQAECYIRALQWTLSYYYHGVQSWSWYYPHHYAPYISDLKDFKGLNIKFEMSEPFLPFQQLMSVLPCQSRDHVPECYKKLMTSPESELIDFYPVQFETDLNGKKQDWEAVVLIPFIDEKRLLRTLEKHDKDLSPDEKARNVHGPMYVYNHASTSQGSLKGPYSFPAIGNIMCFEKMVFREEIQVPKDKLIVGPSKGAMLNVYFTGFPTFKHLNYYSTLKSHNVKVFDQPSRGENMIIVVDSEKEQRALPEIAKELLTKTVYVGWPHLIEAKIVKIADKEQTISAGDTEKTDPQRWRNDLQTIKDHHAKRMGIDVCEVTHVIYVLQATGEEYRFDQQAKIFRLVKTYDRNELAYPLQCVVQNIKAYRKKFQPEVPLIEAFKNGTEVFMLTNPYYGAFGEVVDVNCHEKTGRVKVMLTVAQEPEFDSVTSLHEKTQGSYMNPYQAASALSLSDNVFNRITGTVLVIAGSKRQVSSDTSKLNIGLQLKFPKANEELAGYSKKDRIWLYSQKVISLVQEYYCKFPAVFEVLGRRTGHSNNNDIYFESDFFCSTDGEENLQSLLKWLAQLPHHKAERRQIGTESVEKEVLKTIKETVDKTKDLPVKKVTMQVKPHLLYAPSLTQSTMDAPDSSSDFQLFDRVVIAKDSEKYSIGIKGTVIGINRIKDLNPVRQECVNKEDVYCEILFDNESETGRVAIENLINISFGTALLQTSTSNVKAGPTNTTRYAEKKPKGDSNKQVFQPPPPLAQIPANNPNSSYSAILRKPDKEAESKQNFSEMWNKMKEVNVPAKDARTQGNGNLNLSMENVNLSAMPVVTAPTITALPLPPAAWMKSTVLEPVRLTETVQFPTHPKTRLEMPRAPPNIHSGSSFNVPPPQMIQENKIPIHLRQPVFFASNNVVNHHHNNHPIPQQPRFYNNNNNTNNSYNQHRFNNASQQRPQQQMQQSGSGNPFIPLQASRKATKAKNLQTKEQLGSGNSSISLQASHKGPNAQNLQPNEPLKETKHVVNKSETSQVASVEELVQPKLVVDNRKSRLGISFGN